MNFLMMQVISSTNENEIMKLQTILRSLQTILRIIRNFSLSWIIWMRAQNAYIYLII